VVIEGDVTLNPVPIKDPPVVAEYQSLVSLCEAVPDKVTVPVPHLETSVTKAAFGDEDKVNTAAFDNRSVVHVPFIKH
jgi:hypothetical protein